jgi:hypothetical protein
MIELIELLNWTPGGVLSYLFLASGFVFGGFVFGLYAGAVISINGFSGETVVFIWITYIVAVLSRAGFLYSLHRYGYQGLKATVNTIERKKEARNRSPFNLLDPILFVLCRILRKLLAGIRQITKEPISWLNSLSERQLSVAFGSSRTILFPLGAPIACIAGFFQVPARKFFVPVAVGQITFCTVVLFIGWYCGKKVLVMADALGVLTAIATSLLVVLGVAYLVMKRGYFWRKLSPLAKRVSS